MVIDQIGGSIIAFLSILRFVNIWITFYVNILNFSSKYIYEYDCFVSFIFILIYWLVQYIHLKGTFWYSTTKVWLNYCTNVLFVFV